MDYYIPSLLNQKALNIVTSNVIKDINSIMLVGNEFGILNRIAQLVVKCLFDVETLTIRGVPFDRNKENDGEYFVSEYHMEFELSDKALGFIKSIINNNNISNRQFVFVLKNAEPSLNKQWYLALRRIMDINPTAKFIITTSSVAFMEKSLMSRVLMVHCNFPFDNILRTDLLSQALKTMSKQQLYDVYMNCNFNIITLLQSVSNKFSSFLWQQTIDALLSQMKAEKKPYDVIMVIRENVYKLFHVGVPLKDICRYIVITCSKSKNIQDIISIVAECEHATTQGNRDMLLYEKVFLNIYKFL